jgi:hypothetical protein
MSQISQLLRLCMLPLCLCRSVKQRARSGQPVSKKEFKLIVQEAVRGKPMSKDESDLLFRVFDTNKEGLLELSGALTCLPVRCWWQLDCSLGAAGWHPDGKPRLPRVTATEEEGRHACWVAGDAGWGTGQCCARVVCGEPAVMPW